MTSQSTKLIRFTYKIELLEDLHAGSGLGSVWVDRNLVRDRSGRPFIPASHVKGVWRDNMVRLVALKANDFNEDMLSNWFGAAPKKQGDKTRPNQSKLHCPRLEPDGEVETLVWMQTARQRYSRKPAEDTLRTTEYIPAGTSMAGCGFLEGTEADFDLLKALVGRVDRYGGNRSRGDGRIRLISLEKERSPSESAFQFTDPTKNEAGLRLLLKAHEPVRVPRTGSPGNIIESDTRIPGRMLAGAMISRLLESGCDPKMLFSQKVVISDALPLNPTETELSLDELGQLEILPAPLEYRIAKKLPKPAHALKFLPAWSTENTQDGPITNWQDLLAGSASTGQDELGQVKRLPAGTYIQKVGNRPWRAFRQRLELAMRNRRGSDGGGKSGEMENELFSNEQMPAGTCFVVDIQPLDDKEDTNEDFQEWLKAVKALCNDAPYLFVGRGRAPLEIIAATDCTGSTQVGSKHENAFRLTLVSDAIIRTDWLGFHQRLSLQALRDALGDHFPANILDIEARDVSDSRIDRAFNAATRLPRPSVIVLRAGSSIEVRGKGANALRDVLMQLNALGEKRHEGLGRFRLDLDLKSSATVSVGADKMPDDMELTGMQSETVAASAKYLFAKYKNNLGKLSTSQWGSIRASLDALGRKASANDLHKIRNDLKSRAQRTSGGKVYGKIAENGGFLDQLMSKIETGWSIEDIRLCLRLTLAQIPRKRDPEDFEKMNEQPEAYEENH